MELEIAGEVNESSRSLIEKMAGCKVATKLLVHHHAAHAAFLDGSVHQDDGPAMTLYCESAVQRTIHRSEDDAGDPRLIEELQIAVLFHYI